jgi:protein transport protein SEC24
MVRPPQPPAYVFVLDVSARAVQCGLVTEVCQTILANLDKLPGGQRTQVPLSIQYNTIYSNIM